VEFGEDDLKHLNVEKSKLIKEKNMNVEEGKANRDEAELLKSLFVTQVDDAAEEFEREKNEEVEQTIGKSVARTTIKQGWGTWAGEGVDNSRQEAQQQKFD